MKDKNAMLAAMKKEIVMRAGLTLKNADDANKTDLHKLKIETLYFGGGTPSVLSIDDLAGLLETVHQYFTLDAHAEITLEANPDDLNDDYLSSLRSLGFNRLSIGVQSFYDDDLKWMNRRHNVREAIQSVEDAHKTGFHNINIDIMYGLPSMTPTRWEANLKQALALAVPHLSAYHLTIEPRTVFGKRQAKGETYATTEDESAAQFNILMDIMENAGYEHYEISNFARPKFRSRHNTAYWQQNPYIGIGPAAHSYDGKSRQWNISNNSGYIAALEKESIWFEREVLTTYEQYNEYILLSLRTDYGVHIRYLRDHFDHIFADEFLRQLAVYLQNGYMQEQAGIYTLTRKGKMIVDRIASDLFWV